MSYIIYIPMFHYCNWSLLMIFHYYTSSISHTSHFQQWHSTNHIIYVINDIPTTNKSLIFPPFFQPLKNGVLNHVDTQITMGLKLGSKSWRIWGYPPRLWNWQALFIAILIIMYSPLATSLIWSLDMPMILHFFLHLPPFFRGPLVNTIIETCPLDSWFTHEHRDIDMFSSSQTLRLPEAKSIVNPIQH